MAYNKAKEEYRWNQWKAEEEKILREQGVDEETIQKLREYDWDDFNAERRFREHQTSLLDCMELLLEEKETKESQPESVEALLDTVENEELLQILLSTDKKTLQMIVLKMMGYAPKEISHHMELPEPVVQNIYAMDEETIKERGIDHLPETLGEAIDEFEEDVFLRNVLGDHIFYKYLEAKKEEWNVFRSQVTDWEIGEYLYKY